MKICILVLLVTFICNNIVSRLLFISVCLSKGFTEFNPLAISNQYIHYLLRFTVQISYMHYVSLFMLISMGARKKIRLYKQ